MSLTRPAWLLIATAPAYVAFVAVTIATIAQEASTSSDLTAGEIDALGAKWMASHVLWVVPPVLAAIALPTVAQALPQRATRLVPALSATTILFSATYLVINVMAYWSDTPTWGDSALFPWANLASIFAGWFGVHVASMIVLICLAKSRVVRKTAITLAVIYGLYFALEVLTYLPIIFGPETFAGFLGGLPPFLLGIFWAVLGVALLRARVTCGE